MISALAITDHFFWPNFLHLDFLLLGLEVI
jgi:hypothetical protein